MARRNCGQLPLAFVLAMAAEASGASLSDAYDPAKPLRAGDLRKLLNAGSLEAMAANSFESSGDRRLPGDKTAQFFPNFPNFLNCFAGGWRNC